MEETVKLTINRWHKVRGRLATVMDTAKGNATVLGGLRVETLSGVASQVEQLRNRSEAAWQDLILFQRCSALISTIRETVARNSVQVSTLLAELDGVQAQQAVFTGILDAARAPNPSIADLPEALLALKDQSASFSRPITVQILTPKHREEITEKRDHLLKRAFALQEQIAEENQRLVSITFLQDGDIIRQMLGQ